MDLVHLRAGPGVLLSAFKYARTLSVEEDSSGIKLIQLSFVNTDI